MVDPRCVDYIRTNRDKYPLDALKAALIKAGVAPADAEEAVRLAAAPPPQDIPVTAPPVRRAPGPASFAEIFPAAAPAQEPVRAAPPAADRAAAPSLPQGMLPRMRAILLSPAAFFRAMPRSGGWREPLLFVLAMSLAFAVLQIVMVLAFGPMSLGPSRAAATVLAAVFSVAGALVAALVAALIAAGIAHLIWTVLGSQQPFETSLRCVAFTSALLPVAAVVPAIPVAGPWLAIPVSLYGIYLFLPASIEVHGIEKKKAAAVVLVLGVIAFLILLVSAFSARRLIKAVRSRPPSLMEASRTANKNLPPLPAAPSPADIQKYVLGQLAAMQKQSGGAAAPPPDPQAALQAMNAALGALGADGGVEPAAPEGLQALLPAEIPGLTRSEASSGKQKLGAMEIAAAEASYQSPDGGTVTLQILDAGGAGGVMAMALNAAGVSGAPAYKSLPAMEQYDPGTRSGSFQVMAAGRFAVKISGRNVDQKVLREAMDAVDLHKLSALGR